MTGAIDETGNHGAAGIHRAAVVVGDGGKQTRMRGQDATGPHPTAAESVAPLARLTPLGALLVAAFIVVAGLAVTGQMRPWTVSDTPGWLAACAPPGCWAGPRTPLYAWLVDIASAGGRWPGDLPWLQFAALVAATGWLMRGMDRLGASKQAALAVGLALICSNLVVLWTRAILPELFAHAAMLAAIGCTLHLAAGRFPRPALLAAAGFLSGTAYVLKPGLLFMPLFLPILLLALAPARRSVAAALLGATMLPFLLVASWRLATLGDFNIISFGGFQMSGMASLMLTPDIADRLPADLRGTATAIIARRDALVAAHAALPIPLNSEGRRSFVSAAAGYFDILARTHDDVLYGPVVASRMPGETWVAFNARMQRLALATIAAAPLYYAAWVIGALTRLVGHMVVLNLPLALGCLAWLGLSWRPRPDLRPLDVRLLGLLTAVWTLGAGLPVVLLTFPAARYADSAGLMLAAWPIHAALRRVPALSSRANSLSNDRSK